MRRRQPKEVTAEVLDLGADGLGRAQVGERTVRIKNALPDERVDARVLKRRKGEWLAEAHTVEGPSETRTEPVCPYYPRCGGCAMAHMDYPAQLGLKERHLLDALSAANVHPGMINAPTGGPRFGYRTKARLGVRMVGGQVLVGFRESFSNRVGRMDDCLVLTPMLAALIEPLKRLIAGLSSADRIPQVEVAAGDNDCALLLRHLEPLSAADVTLIRSFAASNGVRCYGQSGGYDTLIDLTEESASTRVRHLGYRNSDFGLYFRFLPMDFTQVNLSMNRSLVRSALVGLAAPREARVLDLFCGIGNFSLPLATAGTKVVGLEASASAIERARMNACLNGLDSQCEFAVQDLYDPDCLNLGKASHIVLDPPRSGAGPNLMHWVQTSEAQRIAYVSCSPESFAADAAILIATGFELEQVGIFDMFPHTAHVETLGIFQKPW